MEILVYLVGTWYIIPILVCCSKKDLATLLKILSGVALSEAIKSFFFSHPSKRHKFQNKRWSKTLRITAF
jgi:hypothetical protein